MKHGWLDEAGIAVPGREKEQKGKMRPAGTAGLTSVVILSILQCLFQQRVVLLSPLAVHEHIVRLIQQDADVVALASRQVWVTDAGEVPVGCLDGLWSRIVVHLHHTAVAHNASLLIAVELVFDCQ